jgi:putative transcriptional regulator
MGRDTVPGFAARLRQFREARGWSLGELARRSGTHITSLSKVETEQRAPSLRLALALATALGVSLDELVREPVAPDPAPAAKPRPAARKPKA